MEKARVTYHKSSIKSVPKWEGAETIEEKVRRITTEKTPIPSEIMVNENSFQPRSEGVGFDYNPRSDRFEEAVDNMDKASRSLIARRDSKPDPEDDRPPVEGSQSDGEAES